MIRRTKYAVTLLTVSVCWAALIVLSLVGVTAREDIERAPLNYDVPVTARLNKGATHRYPILLTAGQYVQVEAKALRDRITMELMAPDGRKLMKMKSRHGISVAAVAEETASCFVKITATDPQTDGVE